MTYYLRHDDIHLETGRRIREPGRKKESDLKSFNNLIRAEVMGNQVEKKKRIKYVTRKYMLKLIIQCNEHKNGMT